MRRSEAGFTIVEVLVAVLILSIGIIALAGTSGAVSRMIGQGKRDTKAGHYATQRLERIRQQALRATPVCSGLASGSESFPQERVTVSWTVTTPASAPNVRVVIVQVTYPSARGPRTETVATELRCA